MKNFNSMGIHWKIWFLRGVHEKPIYRGELPKKGAWTVCRFKGRLGTKEGEGCWYLNAHYAYFQKLVLEQFLIWYQVKQKERNVFCHYDRIILNLFTVCALNEIFVSTGFQHRRNVAEEKFVLKMHVFRYY